jgi:integrase
MSIKNYTSFKLIKGKAKKNEDRKWKVWANYKTPNGYKREQFTLEHNGSQLTVGNSDKKLVDKVFAQFKADMYKGTPSSEYIKEDKLFVDRVLEIVPENRNDHYMTAFKLIKENVDEWIFRKKINEVMNQDYLVNVQESFQKMIEHLENDRADKVNFPKRKITPQGIRNHFGYFKTTVKLLAKKKIGSFYPINLEAIDLPKISNETRNRLATKEKFLSAEQEQLIYQLPEWAEITKGRRGSNWGDNQWDIRSALIFAMNTGYRISDIAKVQWDHLGSVTDKDGNIIQVVYLMTQKRSKDSFVPLSQEVIDHLPQKRENSPYIFNLKSNTNRNCKILERYMGYASMWLEENGLEGDTNITWHKCRHTFNMKMRKTGVRADVLGKMIGCSARNITKTYTVVTDDDIIAVNKNVSEINKVKLVKRSKL